MVYQLVLRPFPSVDLILPLPTHPMVAHPPLVSLAFIQALLHTCKGCFLAQLVYISHCCPTMTRKRTHPILIILLQEVWITGGSSMARKPGRVTAHNK